jgi:hypothetical protein
MKSPTFHTKLIWEGFEHDDEEEDDDGQEVEDEDDEVQFITEQPNRFLARSSPQPSRNRQPQNNSNPETRNPDPYHP